MTPADAAVEFVRLMNEGGFMTCKGAAVIIYCRSLTHAERTHSAILDIANSVKSVERLETADANGN